MEATAGSSGVSVVAAAFLRLRVVVVVVVDAGGPKPGTALLPTSRTSGVVSPLLPPRGVLDGPAPPNPAPPDPPPRTFLSSSYVKLVSILLASFLAR